MNDLYCEQMIIELSKINNNLGKIASYFQIKLDSEFGITLEEAQEDQNND